MEATLPDLSDHLQEPAEEIHSWLYWATRRTRAVHLWAAAATVVAALVFLFGLIAVNPSLPGNWGWNTVEHIADPVPGHDYQSEGLNAMAQSGEWLGLATPRDGLVVLSTATQVPVARGSGAVLDTAAASADGAFFTLSNHQGVDISNRWIDWRSSPWLLAPQMPAWPSDRTIQPDDVIFAEWHKEGLTLGVRGLGMARNLFRREANRVARTRDWQVSTLSNGLDLTEAVSTRVGYWLRLGDGTIRFANAETLQERSERGWAARGRGKPRAFNYGRTGAWATVIDGRDGLWLFRDGEGWSGPWFDLADGGPRSADDVRVARLWEGGLWLGARDGLYVYDQNRHAFGRPLKKETTGIEPIPSGVLATGPTGLYFASANAGAASLDAGPIHNLQLSPRADLAVYSIGSATLGADQPRRWRFIVDPGRASTPQDVAIAGIQRRVATPEIRAALPRQDGVLLAGSLGCFVYDHGKSGWPHYRDCSKAKRYTSQESDVTIKDFEWLSQEDGAILAEGDGVVLGMSAGNQWIVQDPDNQSGIRRATAVAGEVFAVGESGALVQFGPRGKPVMRLGGTTTTAANTEQLRGDIDGQSSSWRVLISQDNRLAEYASLTGNWVETRLNGEPKQALLFGSDVVLVTADGRFEVREKAAALDAPYDNVSATFGSGELAFPPAQTSAVGLARDGAVLVAGPDAQVFRYVFASAEWVALPRPTQDPGKIVELSDFADGLWLRTDDDVVLRWHQNSWKKVLGVSRWAVDQQGRRWTLDAKGVAMSQVPGRAPAKRFNTGVGLRRAAREARYLWQPDASRIVLVGETSIGVYDQHGERWQTVIESMPRASGFRSFDDGLMIFTEAGAWWLSSSLDLRPASFDRDDPIGRSGNPELESPNTCSNPKGVDSQREGLWVMFLDLWVTFLEWIGLRSPSSMAPPQIGTCSSDLAPSMQGIPLPEPTGGPSGLPVAPPKGVLSYANLKLDWVLTPDEGVQLSWRDRPDLPVWCSDRERLAIQCVRDLALDSQRGTLALQTEFAVVWRSATDFALRELELRQAASLDDLRRQGPVPSGPWAWQLQDTGLEVTEGDSTMNWYQTSTGSGWRLTTDRVLEIATNDETGLLLQSAHGTWHWTITEGRSTRGASFLPRVKRVQTPALTLSADKGNLHLQAFDGGKVFVNGRFFFDHHGDVRGRHGSLYTLVPKRAILRRNPANLADIQAAWPLPADLGEEPALLAMAGACCIAAADSRGAHALAEETGIWKRMESLGPSQTNPSLRPHAVIPDRVESGPVVWERNGDGAFAVRLGASEVFRWWAGDRFTWDQVSCVGAANDTRLLIATGAGVVVRGESGRFLEFLAAPDYSTCEIARRDEEIIGTLLGRDAMLRSDGGSGLTLDEAPKNLQPVKASVFFSGGQPGSNSIFSEEWFASADGHLALSSGVAELPTAHLLCNRRFLFDRPAVAGWHDALGIIAITDCPGQHFALGTVYALAGGQIRLRAHFAPPPAVIDFGSASSGDMFALNTDHKAFVFDKDRVQLVPTEDAGDAFDAGHTVILELPDFIWRHTPRKRWSSGPNFSVDPYDYPLFTSHAGGTLFAFDHITTLATDPRHESLHLGTLGGLFSCSTEAGQAPFVDLTSWCEFAPSLRRKQHDPRSLPAKKLRFDQRGVLWVLRGQSEECVCDDKNRLSPFSGVHITGTTILFEEGAIVIGGNTQIRSNNAWFPGRRAFSKVVDACWDEAKNTLWLADQRAGLFAVRPPRLGDIH